MSGKDLTPVFERTVTDSKLLLTGPTYKGLPHFSLPEDEYISSFKNVVFCVGFCKMLEYEQISKAQKCYLELPNIFPKC